MKKWIIVILIIVIATGFYNYNKKEGGYQTINPIDAKTSLEEDKDAILLDVRTKEEYEEKHIAGSILVPVNLLEQEIEDKIPNKKQKIIVYCHGGSRSKTAVKTLLKLGYKNVYDLGGINDWPYETK